MSLCFAPLKFLQRFDALLKPVQMTIIATKAPRGRRGVLSEVI